MSANVEGQSVSPNDAKPHVSSSLVSETDSEAGETVALIHAVINLCNIISTRDFFDDTGIVQEAIKDLRSNDGMKRLMDIGKLQDAKDYIQQQKRTIKLLLATSKLTDEALKEFGDKLAKSRGL